MSDRFTFICKANSGGVKFWWSQNPVKPGKPVESRIQWSQKNNDETQRFLLEWSQIWRLQAGTETSSVVSLVASPQTVVLAAERRPATEVALVVAATFAAAVTVCC